MARALPTSNKTIFHYTSGMTMIPNNPNQSKKHLSKARKISEFARLRSMSLRQTSVHGTIWHVVLAEPRRWQCLEESRALTSTHPNLAWHTLTCAREVPCTSLPCKAASSTFFLPPAGQ